MLCTVLQRKRHSLIEIKWSDKAISPSQSEQWSVGFMNVHEKAIVCRNSTWVWYFFLKSGNIVVAASSFLFLIWDMNEIGIKKNQLLPAKHVLMK